MDLDKVRVINAAGKLTALGGSAQSDETANAQAFAAKLHVDMNQLRQEVSNQIADLCGTEAACVTSGAAAGISVSVAALICKDRPELVTQLPRLLPSKAVVVQAGHNINFGASIEQMVHMTGADCQVVGTASEVTPANIEIAFKEKPIALLYVQSHHCIQENRVSLADCISLAHSHDVPVIVDAAAEDDLQKYISMGADLVTYSGGKAFCGPTSGFIVGKRDLIELCELQFRGIARPMKVSKEQIVGLSAALYEYIEQDHALIQRAWNKLNQQLINTFLSSSIYQLETKPDEAGRDFERVAITSVGKKFDCKTLVRFLIDGTPSIRTRNHQIANQRILIDPRELSETDMQKIISRLEEFEKIQS